MSFGYKENGIYLHSSREGRKIKILKKNPRVCFKAAVETEIITADFSRGFGKLRVAVARISLIYGIEILLSVSPAVP